MTGRRKTLYIDPEWVEMLEKKKGQRFQDCIRQHVMDELGIVIPPAVVESRVTVVVSLTEAEREWVRNEEGTSTQVVKRLLMQGIPCKVNKTQAGTNECPRNVYLGISSTQNKELRRLNPGLSASQIFKKRKEELDVTRKKTHTSGNT